MLRRTIARLSEAAFMSEPSTGATGARDKPWIFRTYAGHSTAHDLPGQPAGNRADDQHDDNAVYSNHDVLPDTAEHERPPPLCDAT